MNAFFVDRKNVPGELATVTEALAKRGVNLLVYGVGMGADFGISFLAGDEQAARAALKDAGITFRESPAIFVKMEDKPGQAAKTARILADAGVNIELFQPVDTSPKNFTVALAVDNVDAARKAVGDQLTEFSYR
jgi:hypothetical protein